MRTVSDEEVREWCKAKSIAIAGDHDLYYDLNDVHSFELPFPDGREDLILQAFRLSGFSRWNDDASVLLSQEQMDFKGSLLWVTKWDVWGEKNERLGLTALDRMRSGLGQSRLFAEAPGHLFEASEYLDQVAFLSTVVLCEWDSFLIPENGEYFIQTTHECFSYVVARTAQISEKLSQHLRAWNPVRKPPYYFRSIQRFP